MINSTKEWDFMDKKINNTPSVDALMKMLDAQRDTIDRLRENYDELSKKYSNLYDENERMHNKLKL
tara:strand:+ start:1277 stop:1474 length:198 start_codon:yes stop_codon:yes gene_type:complete